MVSKGTVAAIIVGGGAAALALAYAVQAQQVQGGACAPPTGMFGVQVLDIATKKAISGASVNYNNTTKTTNANGCVAFAPIIGFSPLDVTAAGYQEVLEPNFQATAGQVYQVLMTSTGAGALSATVVVKNASTLQPVAGAKVTLDGQSGTTDSTGSVVFQGLTLGTTYTITASATGYVNNSQQFTLTSNGETFTITLVGGVPYNQSWTGYEFSFPGPPFNSAFAFWQNQNSIPITGSMWVVVKNGLQQTVAIGQSPLTTIQPANPNPPPVTDQKLTAIFSAQLASGTYVASFFCVDSAGAPISKVFAFTITIP